MMYPHPIIAKEGWLYLVVIGVFAFVVHRYAGFFWSWPLWLFFIFTLQFFRDPQRIAPLGKDLVLSPADGRIVVVEKAHDPYANREALKISVFMNVFNVHSIGARSPVLSNRLPTFQAASLMQALIRLRRKMSEMRS